MHYLLREELGMLGLSPQVTRMGPLLIGPEAQGQGCGNILLENQPLSQRGLFSRHKS